MSEPTITVVIPVAPEHDEVAHRAAASCDGVEGADWVIFDRAQGRSVARNGAVASAKTDWVLFLDADDELMPRAIERMRWAIERQPNAQMVYPRVFLFRSLPDEPHRHVVLDRWSRIRTKVNRREMVDLFITVGYRRDRFLELGGFDPESEDDERLDMPIRFALSEDVEVAEIPYHVGGPIVPFARINGERSTRWVGGQVGVRSDRFPGRRPFEAWLKAGKYEVRG